MEQWRAVVGYADRYQVSSLGRVRGLPSKYHPNATMLSLYRDKKTGYLSVTLSVDGVRKGRTVHSLVAEAFLGERPSGHVVCHRDGSRDNNCVENLRYGTQSSNLLDRAAHGTYRSEAHGMAKLTAYRVRKIRLALARGVKPPVLARLYEVTRELIYLIRDRKIWKDI